MSFLLVSLGMLALAPLIFAVASHIRLFWAILDKLTIIAVGGLVFFHLVPESYEQGGLLIFVTLLAGLTLPSLLERAWHHQAPTIHKASILIAVMGLAVHGMLDGAALVLPEMMPHAHEGHDHLHQHIHQHGFSIAVLGHRLFEGLFIWGLFYKRTSWHYPVFLLTCLGAFTIVGYALGETIFHSLEGTVGLSHFQAFFSGSLLHIVFDHHTHPDLRSHSTHSQTNL